MKRLLVLVAMSAGFVCLAVGAQSSSTSLVVQTAEKFAVCMKALDAECVIQLSDVDRYNLLGAAGTGYVRAQVVTFERFKEIGKRYVRFDIGSPWPEFSARGVTYVFVPYVSELSGLPEVRSYLVGVSDNVGTSWKFFDGAHITPENIQKVIPGYAGQQLPESNVTQHRPAS